MWGASPRSHAPHGRAGCAAKVLGELELDTAAMAALSAVGARLFGRGRAERARALANSGQSLYERLGGELGVQRAYRRRAV